MGKQIDQNIEIDSNVIHRLYTSYADDTLFYLSIKPDKSYQSFRSQTCLKDKNMDDSNFPNSDKTG